MSDMFLEKLNNNEYISTALYQSVLANNSSLIPNSFNLDKYNETVLNNLYEKYKDYFKNMYVGIDNNIELDEEQIKAILADEDYALIIAGAGTGKTTTMAAKVKYLVDIKNIDPAKILVMSYTKKATKELEKRIVDDFNIPAKVTTFHSLGLDYIRLIFNRGKKIRKCSVIDENEKEEIFLEYFKGIFKDKESLDDLLVTFSPDTLGEKWVFSNFFKENCHKFNTYEEFLEEYKKEKIKEAKKVGIESLVEEKINDYINGEPIKTIRGEIVKSVGEATIANFLFKKGINYSYEKIYSELMDDNHVYKPDFTLELAGTEVYLEYFGMDDKAYNRIKKEKEKFHSNSNNMFIEIDRMPIQKIEEYLDKELKKLGFTYKEKTMEEIYYQILSNNHCSQIFKFKKFLFNCIEKIKNSNRREEYKDIINQYIESLSEEEKAQTKKQFKYINQFYILYQKRLYGAEEYKFDYSDLLFYANKYIENIGHDNYLNFEYIIIDEYQDISRDKYELAKKTADRNNSKVFAVGDDWQSIYAFSGSRIDYIYRFKQFFKGAKEFRITKTYRNSQELIDYSGEFVMKNDMQIKKELISTKHLYEPIKFVEYDSSEDIKYEGEKRFGYQEYLKLKELILKIHSKNPEHNILVLARTNSMINKCFKITDLEDDIDSKVRFVGHEDISLDAMTMHKSKGLTFDEVILIGLNNHFPLRDYSKFWLEGLFKYKKLEESVPFAEERRLFYVALTRTKNNVYLLVDKQAYRRSPFIDEIYDIVNNNE